MQICSTGVLFLFLFLKFLPVQVNTPAGLKGHEVTRSLPLPSITPYTVAQLHGRVCQGVSSGRQAAAVVTVSLLREDGMLLFFQSASSAFLLAAPSL